MEHKYAMQFINVRVETWMTVLKILGQRSVSHLPVNVENSLILQICERDIGALCLRVCVMFIVKYWSV